MPQPPDHPRCARASIAFGIGRRLMAVDEAIEHLEEQYAAGSVYHGANGAQRFAAMMSRLEERRDRLAALPSTPARNYYRPTGRTFADRWQEEGQAGRRQLMLDAGFKLLIARTSIDPAGIAAEARCLGITASGKELRNRAAYIRYMASKTTKPERLAVLDAELAAVEATRKRLRKLRKFNEVVSIALNEDLARRAGLATAGKPVEIPDLSEEWDVAPAPVRAAFGAGS